MPIGIFLYEIEKSFGPQIIADYYITQEKISTEILKMFNEKHINKGLADATHRKGKNLYYSSIIEVEKGKKNLYLGFILKEDEELMSLKSLFENVEERVVKNFTKDKKKMQGILKDILNSTIDLFEKLKQPSLIKDTINEKTKQMLDEGKLQEARELIDLGEKIPDKLAEEMKLAEQYLNEGLFRKSKKSYLKSAEYAEQIREDGIVNLLTKKAEHIGELPDLIKTRDVINKGMKKSLQDLEDVNLEYKIYKNLIPLIEKNIKLSYSFNDNEKAEILEQLLKLTRNASIKASDLKRIDVEIKGILKKVCK